MSYHEIFPHLSPAASVLEAAKLMLSEECAEVFISDENEHPLGVVRQVDVVRSVASGVQTRTTPVKEIMLKPPPTVDEDATAEEVSRSMAKNEMRRILVRRGKDIVVVIEAGELFDLVSSSIERVEVFKAISVRARFRMAELLSIGPMSVEELAERLGIKPITVRHHLEVLRRNGIVEEVQRERQGRVGRPLSLFKTTSSVLKRGAFRS